MRSRVQWSEHVLHMGNGSHDFWIEEWKVNIFPIWMSVNNSVFGGDDGWVGRALYGFLCLTMVLAVSKCTHDSKINYSVLNKIIGEFYKF